MMVVFPVLSLGMLNRHSKYTPSLEYAFSIGYVSNDDSVSTHAIVEHLTMLVSLHLLKIVCL